MKLIKELIFGILILTTTITTSQESLTYRSEYYAHLPFWESPYQPFKAASNISKDVASSRIHIQFDYNASNQVIASHVKLGDHYKEFEGFFGNININATITKVTYGTNQETHHFFDRFGNPVSVMGNVFTKVYQKNSHGNNIQLTFFDKQGNATTDLFGIKEYKWAHEIDGSIIEERFSSKGSIVPLRGIFQFKRTRMIFDNQGYFTALQNIDANGELINSKSGAATFRYYYDSEGRFDRWEVYDKDGNKAIGPSNTSGEQNTYHQYDLKDIIFFGPKGNPATHWSGAERWHFEVDKYGNNLYLEFQDAKGNAINANSGYSKYQWIWSTDGRYLLAEAYYDKDQQKTVHKSLGIHKVVYTRNNKGLVVSKKYLDVDGNLTNRLDTGIAIEEIIYDQNNIKSESRHFDKDGKKLK